MDEHRIECPFCHQARIIPSDKEFERLISAEVFRGPSGYAIRDAFEKIREKIKILSTKPVQDSEDAWIQLKPCSFCGRSYSYNFLTHEVKKWTN